MANNSLTFNVTVPGRVLRTEDARGNVSSRATLSCILEGYPLGNVTWERDQLSGLDESPDKTNFTIRQVNKTTVETHLEFPKLNRRDNGLFHLASTLKRSFCDQAGTEPECRGSPATRGNQSVFIPGGTHE
ncbi:uncharacterized protein LOC113465300 [Diaphorina citri]|uniref:Uncharacterized protein LOC113465300 n=1 Tax=Diaphorina citri TaxID=121845 RepID=A0A3Q0IPA3_DIACI|nr:uncharacterized protein LOC113465300 [Diaphorina citri]